MNRFQEIRRLLRLNSKVVIDSYGNQYRYTDKKPIVLDGEVLLCLQSLDDFGYYYVSKNDLVEKEISFSWRCKYDI